MKTQKNKTMNQEKAYNENELNNMIDALQDAVYKLECFYNSDIDDRNDIVWNIEQLDKIENLLINLKNYESTI